ncbi:MAG: ABC transporter ATP-binding protein [Alphaproteobacteria bacterium]|nr:ABC transporter ATP-binding protein [Alphaproteobacteria bacterium]
MLRRIIGRPKSSNKKRSTQGLVLPKSLWKFYFKYAVPSVKWTMLTWGVFFIITLSSNVMFPYFERWFIQLFETPVPEGVSFVQFALPTILIITVLNVVFSVSGLLRSTFLGRWGPKSRNQISVVLTDYTHSQSLSFWTGRMAGSVNSQITYVADGFRVVEDLWRVVWLVITMCVSAGLIFSINKYVAVIFACVFVFRVVYSYILIKPMDTASKEASSAHSELSGKLVDSFSNFSVVKLFAGAKREQNYLEPIRKKRVEKQMYTFFVTRLFSGVPAVIWDLCYGGTLLLCAFLYMRGEILLSEIVFTISVYFNVMAMISSVVDQIPVITERLSSASKAYAELVVPIEVRDIENAPSLQVKNGKIEIKNLSFRYKRKWILRNFNLTIKPGERVGLVGPSGAGKTTLVHLLMRFYDPDQGVILIDNQDIKEVAQDSLRESIAFIPQEPTMFNRTLCENIAYGKMDATDAELRKAAKRAAAHEFIMGTEKKYDSMVGDRGIKLSGGQKQRVAIARAFLKDAPILVLDEATSALDSETEVAIQKSFDDLAQGRTTVAIAHRLSTLRNMDRIVVLKDGHIVEQGTHNQLLRKRGEYARLWKMQSGGFLQE